ncbi:hypothetical protein CXR34_08600 [Microbacterium hominis]|uniref:Uncharacterized protein n=2 Tax=Microbacteriaceae TaxID=85023 RepID=A0A2K9DJ29_9MICO|nr:hypothetical protein CXR34_08600 [Microbacterium hominis]
MQGMNLRLPAMSASARELNRIAGIIERVPGPEGDGLHERHRATVFAYVNDPTSENWRELRRMPLTRTLTVWVAVMRTCGLGLYQQPTSEQILEVMQAATNRQIAH